jgi:hypothetical protein
MNCFHLVDFAIGRLKCARAACRVIEKDKAENHPAPRINGNESTVANARYEVRQAGFELLLATPR